MHALKSVIFDESKEKYSVVATRIHKTNEKSNQMLAGNDLHCCWPSFEVIFGSVSDSIVSDCSDVESDAFSFFWMQEQKIVMYLCLYLCRLLFFFGYNRGEILGYSSVHCASVCGVFCDVKSREKSFQ